MWSSSKKAAEVFEGYEPNVPVTPGTLAMATRRARSLDPNPFWSMAARDEWELQQARPEDLPANGGAVSDEGLRVDELPPVPDEEDGELDGRSRTESASRGAIRAGEGSVDRAEGRPFTTPASWSGSTGRGKGRATHGEGVAHEIGERSEGMMPMEEPSETMIEDDAREILDEEIKKHRKRARGDLHQQVQDDLERAMEKEIVYQLHEENARLKQKVEQLLQRQKATPQSSRWSEVSATVEEMPRPPAARTTLERQQCTPNGTPVPKDPPPVDEELWNRLPAWPLKGYEKVECGYPCANVMGEYVTCIPGAGVGLHERRAGRGNESRFEQGELSGVCRGGNQSRSSGRMEDGDPSSVLTPAEARARWLEREVSGLRGLLEREGKGSAIRNSEYWNAPFPTTRSQGHQPVGSQEVQRGDRAWQDRQAQGEQDLSGDRAWRDRRVQDAKVLSGDHVGQDHGEDGMDRRGGPSRGQDLFEESERQGRLHEEEKDVLKAIPVVLPMLPEHQGRESGIICGDWMVQVRPLIGDVAPMALCWWDDLMSEVMRRYQTWLQSDPLERLRMPSPQQGLYNFNATRKRLELRISTMLLAAMPPSLKEEVVASRQLTAGEIMYKVLRHYQPGGVQEKTETLQSLSVMQSAKTAKEAVESLRRWRRRQLRALELHASLPDPSIMVKGLTTLCAEILMLAPQASFRLSTFRLQQRLDINPTTDSLDAYYQMLLAEMEHLSLSPESTTTALGGSRSSAPDTPSGAKVKALKPGSPTPGGTSVCRAWGTEGGCRFGRECKFGHDWSSLADKGTRCWICSGVGHQKAACPFRRGDASGGSGSGGSPGVVEKGKGQKGKGKTKDSPGKGEKGKGGKPGQGTPPKVQSAQSEEKPTTSTSSSTTSAAAATAGGDNKAQEPKGSTGEAPLMNEAVQLLKKLVAPATINMMSIKSLKMSRALLDSGATHALRMAASEEEWLAGQPTRVVLADGETDQLRLKPGTRTLLAPCQGSEASSMILPMHEVSAAGYSVKWTEGVCSLQAPGGAEIAVEQGDGCPTVDAEVGQKILEKLEQRQQRGEARRKKLQRLEVGELRPEELDIPTALMMSCQAMFEDVPDYILQKVVPEDFSLDENQQERLPWNRRCRRRHQKAKRIILHLYSGPDEKYWVEKFQGPETEVICIDTCLNPKSNMLNDATMVYLIRLVLQGKIAAVIGGPPCRTVSACRYHEQGTPEAETWQGPRPVRSEQYLGCRRTRRRRRSWSRRTRSCS